MKSPVPCNKQNDEGWGRGVIQGTLQLSFFLCCTVEVDCTNES